MGVRGNRIKNIIDELSGERIDIVRYDEEPLVMIPNSLQPAQVDEVILCREIGRAIVLVAEDQLSLAIGKRGQNVRLASKLCGWDIEIMTQDELEQQIDRAVQGFSAIDGIDDELASQLVGNGFLSYDDLEVIEPEFLMSISELTQAQVDHIVAQAEVKAAEAERQLEEQKRQRRENEQANASSGSGPTKQTNNESVDAGSEASESASPEQTDVSTAPEDAKASEAANVTDDQRQPDEQEVPTEESADA